MIYLDNMLLWDAEFNPTRIPRITLDPLRYGKLKSDEKWIICGKWKIRILIEPSEKGLIVKDKNGTLKMDQSLSGSMFLDDNFFEIDLVDKSNVTKGSVSGCFDIRW